MKIFSSFVFFASVLTSSLILSVSCGSTEDKASEVKSGAVPSSSCGDQVGDHVDGTRFYTKYIAITFPDVPSAHNNGKIDGCFFPSDTAARAAVRSSCNNGGTSTCEEEIKWQPVTKSFTFTPSGNPWRPAQEAPKNGGCYQKVAMYSAFTCNKETTQNSCSLVPAHSCEWARPAPSTPQFTKSGIYRTKIGTIFYFDGGRHFCSYPNVEYYNAVGRPAFTETPTDPSTYLVNDGSCAFPVGHFRVGVDIFFSNGSHYCKIKSNEDYIKIGQPKFWQSPIMPPDMPSDGNCVI